MSLRKRHRWAMNPGTGIYPAACLSTQKGQVQAMPTGPQGAEELLSGHGYVLPIRTFNDSLLVPIPHILSGTLLDLQSSSAPSRVLIISFINHVPLPKRGTLPALCICTTPDLGEVGKDEVKSAPAPAGK